MSDEARRVEAALATLTLEELAWEDVQGDRFLIERNTTVEDPAVIAGVLVGDHSDGEGAAVWVTRDQALALIAWLGEALDA